MRNLVLPLLISVGYLVGCGSNTVTSTGTTGANASSTTGGTGTSSGGDGTTGNGSAGAGSTGTSTTGTSSTGAATTGGGSAGAYPSGPYGVTVNRIIQNFTLPGYLSTQDTKQSNTLTYNANLSLQDFRNAVDSSGHLFRYLLLDISAGWCNPCNAEADDLGLHGADKAKITEWLGKGGLMFTVLVEGYSESTHALPVAGDIDTWTNAHEVQYSMGWDPTGTLLNQGISPSAFPTNLVIDLTTMKIVSAWYGIDTAYPKWEAVLNAP